MKKFVIQSAFLIIVIFAALYFTTKQNLFVTPAQPQITKQAIINGININIELADTPEKRKKGLGGRESLASDSGMLFVFEKPDKYAFWMKGLKFPLDFIWIREKQVVDIIKNAKVPESGQKDEDLPRYLPNQVVDSVLEVNAGFVDSLGIKVGDSIEIVR